MTEEELRAYSDAFGLGLKEYQIASIATLSRMVPKRRFPAATPGDGKIRGREASLIVVDEMETEK